MEAITLDLDLMHWSIADQRAYYKQVGVTAYEALDAAKECKQAGDLLRLPPDYLFGFVWIAKRRVDHDCDFEALADAIDLDTMLDIFLDAFGEEDEEPDPTQEASASQPSKTPSASAGSTAGRKPKSKPSPSMSTTQPLKSQTKR